MHSASSRTSIVFVVLFTTFPLQLATALTVGQQATALRAPEQIITTTLYVGANGGGSDAPGNNGTDPTQPLATIERALQLAKEQHMTHGLDANVSILLYPGHHEVNETLMLDNATICGSALRIGAYKVPTGAGGVPMRPVISGGSTLQLPLDPGFIRETPNGTTVVRYSMVLPEDQFSQYQVWQLWRPVAGSYGTQYRRVLLANTGTIHYAKRHGTETDVVIHTDLDPPPLQEQWRTMYALLYHSWTASISNLTEFNFKESAFRVGGRVSSAWFGSGNRFRLLNYIDDTVLDSLSEEAFTFGKDTRELVVYYPLPAGANCSNASSTLEVMVPRLQTIMNISACENLVVEDVQFSFTDSYLDQCLSFGCDGQSAAKALPVGGVHAEGSFNNSLFQRVHFLHHGLYPLYLNQGSRDVTVYNCLFRDLGAGGVRIGATFLGLGSAEEQQEVARDITVDHCTIHDGGHILEAGTGILLTQAKHCKLTRNLIYDLYYAGISTGWTWGFDNNNNEHIRVEENYVHNVGRGRLSDMGCIYNVGVSPGSKFRHNLCHDVQTYGYGGWGLYGDAGTSFVEWSHNIMYRTKCGGMHQHYGIANVIVNNVFAFTERLVYTQGVNNGYFTGIGATQNKPGGINDPSESISTATIERNIVLQQNKTALFIQGSFTDALKNFTLHNNCYWSTALNTTAYPFPAYPTSQSPNVTTDWADWRTIDGKDAGSVLADPQFVDAAGYNFNDINASSPCVKIGFVPIAPLPKVGADEV